MITQIKSELKELDSQQKQLVKNNLKESSARDNQIQVPQHNIARLRKQYEDNLRIRTSVAGCILELTVSKGDIVQIGDRIGAIK